MLDDVQASFLWSIGLDDESALRLFSLAQLRARRDIAMLGLLHRIALGKAPFSLRMLFPVQKTSLRSYGWTTGARHSHQLRVFIEPGHSAVSKQSLFGLAAVNNRVSPEIAETTSLNVFQRKLQHLLVSCLGNVRWQTMLSHTF